MKYLLGGNLSCGIQFGDSQQVTLAVCAARAYWHQRRLSVCIGEGCASGWGHCVGRGKLRRSLFLLKSVWLWHNARRSGEPATRGGENMNAITACGASTNGRGVGGVGW